MTTPPSNNSHGADPMGMGPIDGGSVDGVKPNLAAMATPEQVAVVQQRLAAQNEAIAQSTVRYTRNQLIARRFFRNKTAVFGLVGLILIVLIAIFGPNFLPWEYLQRDPGQYLKAPGGEHIFGTNQEGRDMLAMTIEGLRKSLIIGFAVAAIQTGIAALVGSAIAYFGGWVDKVGTWFIDLLLVIPSFLIIAVFSQRFSQTRGSTLIFILLLSLFSWMLTARVVRALTLSVTNLDYVRAAKYMNVPAFTIITKHILPNISSLLIVDFTLGVASAVLAETSLSYFGFGIQAPEVSLGSLIGAGQASAITHTWLFLPPAGALVLMLLCVNFIGDGLRDAIDPSSKSGGQA